MWTFRPCCQQCEYSQAVCTSYRRSLRSKKEKALSRHQDGPSVRPSVCWIFMALVHTFLTICKLLCGLISLYLKKWTASPTNPQSQSCGWHSYCLWSKITWNYHFSIFFSLGPGHMRRTTDHHVAGIKIKWLWANEIWFEGNVLVNTEAQCARISLWIGIRHLTSLQ